MKLMAGSAVLRLAHVLLSGMLLAWSSLLHAAALDVGAGEHLRADAAMSWCASDRSLGVGQVIAGACDLQPMRRQDLRQGFDHRAFWLRLELANPGPDPQERWLEVGHLRLTEVALYAPERAGWRRTAIGTGVPLAQRDQVGRRYGLLALQLPPQSHQTLWLRVVTDTLVDLTPTLWQPEAYRESLQASELSNVLGLGGLLPAILFSLIMFGITRQGMFLFYALGITGALLADGFQNGLLQRYLWPEGWPLPVQFLPAAYLLAILAFIALLHAAVPELARFKLLQRWLLAAVALAVMALVYAIVVDFPAATPFWGGLTFAAMLLGGILMLRVWLAAGSRTAGVLFVAILVLIVLGLFRLADVAGLIRAAPELAQVLKFVLLLNTQLFLASMLVQSRDLRVKLAVAQAQSEARVAFLAQMSHELRAPMDTVLGNAQLIARAAPQPAIASRVAAISESGRQLLRLIDDLLDYARGLAGGLRVEPAPLDLDDFLRGIERNGRLLAARQHNQFELQRSGRPPDAMALRLDAGRLRQVLDNLLGNAARHTRDGCIALEVGLKPLDGERLRLEFAVQDSGEGIAPADQQRIFWPFERAGARHGRQGAGLGLAISRQLVELMGGHIAVDSQPGRGACFRFWVETVAESAGSARDASQVEAFEAVGYAGRRRRLLLVDDDETNRAILAALLRELGFEVEEAAGGVAGAERLADAQAPDLVLTDQYMPDGDGWMLLEQLTRLHPGVPALMLSAAPAAPPSLQAAALCAAHFLRPLDHATLLRTIGDLLGLQWLSGQGVAPSGTVEGERPDAVALAELARLVDGGELTAIVEWAHELKERSPRHRDFADKVLAAVDAIDFAVLDALAAEPAKDHAGRKPSTDR